ncbi:MAG: VCBS repeat-containing protein [Candidatus Helarchaeota archaeon]|nr:VCBS repeat-containing protein [Candidatus Helarchaeota archaeon]
MQDKLILKLFTAIWVIGLIFSGFLIQLPRFQEEIQSDTIEIPEESSQQFFLSSDPELKLQWSINTSAYATGSSQLILTCISTYDLANNYNCTIEPELTREALGQFSEGAVVNITSTASTTEFYTDCFINFSLPTNFLTVSITRIDIVAALGINSSIETSQIQLYNRTGANFDTFTPIEATFQNRTISVLSNFQDYLGISNNLTIRFYANHTDPIQANITVDGIIAYVYVRVTFPDILWGLATGDGNGDGLTEIGVVGENGTLICLNGMNGSFLGDYYLKGPTYSVGFSDINGDLRDEVIATRIIDPGFPKVQNITIFDFMTLSPISGYSHTDLPAVNVIGLGAGNIRSNASREVLFLLNRGDLYVFNGETNEELEKVSPIGEMVPPNFGGGANKRFDVNLGDTNGDGILEFVVCGINIQKTKGDASLWQWQGADAIKIWNFTLNSSAYCSIGDFGDVEGDGEAEVVVGTRQNSLEPGGTAYLLEGQTPTSLWEFATGSNNIFDISCGELDTDENDEIAIAVGGTLNYTYILDGETKQIIWGIPSPYEVTGVDIADVNNDGKCEIITSGSNFVNLYCIDSDGDGFSDMDDLDDDNDNLTDWQERNLFDSNQFLLDSDGDNLSDVMEILTYRTYPNFKDSDFDNLTDWQELFVYHTNATNPNSDGDYLTDWEDLLVGFDPRNPDSDHDGYLDSWSYFQDSDTDNLTNFQELNVYHTNPFLPDSDHDNLTDWQECSVYFTNPNSTNTDGDYLTDWQELFIFHTDPRNPDSDGDGFLDGELMQIPPYELFLYQIIAFTVTNLVLLAINVRYFLKFRRIAKETKPISKKAETIRKLIEEAVWYWGHGPQVLKNFDNLVAKNVTTITLETLTRTWTQHYKQQFQKISHLSEEEALERADKQKKQDVVDLYNLLKEKIDIKVVPIAFGKYAGSDSYQFEISETQSEKQKQVPKTN